MYELQQLARTSLLRKILKPGMDGGTKVCIGVHFMGRCDTRGMGGTMSMRGAPLGYQPIDLW